MRSRIPEILVVTRDLAVAHAVTLAATSEWTEWHQGFSSALMAIKPTTEVLVFDGAMDAPLSRLLPTVFVDQRPGRRAIVLQAQGSAMPDSCDPRVTVLPWPLSLEALTSAITGEVAGIGVEAACATQPFLEDACVAA